ncbi:hypothetical protein TNCV_965171 [Trichonephila clavipes]|nr:hypothetical protein TNCV_965171 [Trichonephila clavipes]
MSRKSPFVVHKAIIGIRGEPKSIKKLRSGDLLIKTTSALQTAKPSTGTTTTQTDENITKIVCPPLKLLQPLRSVPKPTTSSSVPAVTKPSTSTQTQLLLFTSSVTVISPSKSKPSIPLIDTAPTISNNFSTPAAFSSSYKALSSSDVSMCLHPYQLKHVLLLKLKPL